MSSLLDKLPDGNEKVFKSKGFEHRCWHPQEIISVISDTHAVTMYESELELENEHGEKHKIPVDWPRLLKGKRGVLLTSAHAIAWDGKLGYDPGPINPRIFVPTDFSDYSIFFHVRRFRCSKR